MCIYIYIYNLYAVLLAPAALGVAAERLRLLHGHH